MPITTAPNVIEQSEFSVGWCPDLERSNIPPDGVLDAQNLLPNKITGALQTRKGFKRLPLLDQFLQGYVVRAVHSYSRSTANENAQFLILVVSNGMAYPVQDNVMVVAYDLKNPAVRILNPPKSWRGAGGRHYGITVNGVFYGGGELDRMYSAYPRTSTGGVYNPAIAYPEGTAVTFGGIDWVATSTIKSALAWSSTTTYGIDDVVTYNGKRWRAKQPHTNKLPSMTSAYWMADDPADDNSLWVKEWNDDASTANYDDYVVVGNNPGNEALGVAHSDRAFKYRDKVSYRGRNYSVGEGLENLDVWKTGQYYEAGEKVRHRYPNDDGYFRAYKVKGGKAHTAAAGSEPGRGASWADTWKLVTLDAPVTEKGDQSVSWDLVPDAPVSNVAAWFGNRLFVRYDDPTAHGLSRLVFSSQASFFKDRRSDITRTRWDSTDWAITGAAGAGWQDFQTATGDTIKALHPFGLYLLVFLRQAVHVIAGVNPESWNVRQLAPVGAISKRAVTEHDGLVYFLGDRGFYVTDGATVQEVPGYSKVRDWFKEAMSWDVAENRGNNAVLWAHAGFIWISVPTGKGKEPDRVIVYDPDTESFWPQELSVTDIAITRVRGIDQLYFGTETKLGDAARATYRWLGNPHRSPSELAWPDGTFRYNEFLNPSFEPPSPTMTNPSGWVTSSGWYRTNGKKVQFAVTHTAARRGYVGAEVTNLRKPKLSNQKEGIGQTFAETTIDRHLLSGYFRLPRRSKETRFNAKDLRLFVGDPQTGQLPEATHLFESVGKGWYRVTAPYTGSLTPRMHGFVIKPGLTVQADQMLAIDSNEATHRYFDGESVDEEVATVGGGTGLVMHYGSDEAKRSITTEAGDIIEYDTDDTTENTYGQRDIKWYMQTAWFPFGVLNEERRIRRLWTMVRGHKIIVALRTLINYHNAPAPNNDEEVSDKIAERETSEFDPVTYLEGVTVPDARAISYLIEGQRAPAAVLGVAAHTEPRRIRFHS